MEKVRKSLRGICTTEFCGRLLMFLLTIFIFVATPQAIFDIYDNFLDRTKYLDIVSPATIKEKTVLPCSTVEIIITRKSLIDISTEGRRSLIMELRSGDQTESVKIRTIAVPIEIRKTDGFSRVTILDVLPCDLEAGTYYYSGVIPYTVRNAEKTESWYSEYFIVETEDGQ